LFWQREINNISIGRIHGKLPNHTRYSINFFAIGGNINRFVIEGDLWNNGNFINTGDKGKNEFYNIIPSKNPNNKLKEGISNKLFNDARNNNTFSGIVWETNLFVMNPNNIKMLKCNCLS